MRSRDVPSTDRDECGDPFEDIDGGASHRSVGPESDYAASYARPAVGVRSDDDSLVVRVEFVVLTGPEGQALRRRQAQSMRRGSAMDRRAPRPRQPLDDALAPEPVDGGREEVLSFLRGIAVANQPADVEAGPVMVPVAFVARVSDKENQDPTLSIPRQLARCREALPPFCVIVAFLRDVESGRTSLDLRGHSDAHELFTVPVPRDGGVADLMEEARQPGRRFVAVVCESVDRLARVTYFGTKIEYELEQSGVANERSRPSGQPSTHPATTRSYHLRSYVICEFVRAAPVRQDPPR
jgi:hypothetical protein